MKNAPANILSLMAVAAELRAAGGSWETIAPQVKRDARTCRGWPQRYPEDWNRLFREAEERLLADVSTEAMFFLRRLLRTEDERLRQNTAKYLYSQRRAWLARQLKDATPAAEPQSEWRRFVVYLESLDEGQVKAFLADCLARWKEQSDAPPSAATGSAGAVPAPSQGQDVQAPDTP